ncbi:uncharacterized protein LOC128676345 [Plodia interpunctella]|uniref:uncharacterized protein LOC128676345 n=1 Tax=Plodia interpunctella TaxID=58824 RepID=UPI002367F474|nr:uncharacterized protein LOC128676345 [Plodia interpunctella]
MNDSYYTQNPISRRQYKNIAFGMTLVAVGKNVWWGYQPSENIFVRLNAKLWVVMGHLATFLEILYGYLNYDLLKKSHLLLSYFISLALYSIVTMKILTAQRDVYRVCVTNFMKEFHLYHFQHENKYNKKKAIKTERFSLFIQCFLILSIFLDALMWFITSLAKNTIHLEEIHNKTMILQGGTYIWMPFDHTYNFKNWILLEIFFMTYLQFGIGLVIFCVDIMTFTFMLHLIGHLDILKNDIESQDWIGLSDLAVRQKLVDIHNRYTFIKRNFKTFEAAYGINIGAIFLFNLIADSLLMYLLMFNEKENQMLYFIMAFYFFNILIALSYATEKIRKLSEDVFIAIYSCPWESMALSNQKTLLLMLVQSQELLDFKACGYSIGYQPMISIIKATFSYYVMLKETNE